MKWLLDKIYIFLNMDKLCQGSITRHRSTKSGEDKSIIDFMLVCDQLKIHLEKMIIDDEKTHILTKYFTMKGIKTKIENTHNVQFAKFSLRYNEIKIKTKREVFMFKNVDCQKTFVNVTENTTKLSSCFQSKEENFLNQSDNFL